ncbi:hypothetical protein DBR11_09335 [Pedobacter sp. HMWF019]|uniref:DUF3823 domain-containing protein n=1 Tax=Pedobacter sp. HMWF019 TaxID=2056856 RepID=UPI000D3B58DF|nr:DUF3823 domain-containing protein [Pedobacter sp. HMWF019]PTT00698.1 hypothetical protein DBR11_09335 [Pedobacter sp. HMWF019]
MKKIMSRILLGASLLAISACTKIDNYPEPNASFEGRLIDKTTGQNFLTSTNSMQVKLEQISWSDTPTPQEIPSKIDGTFKDSKLFKGKYRVTPKGGAFWPILTPLEVNIDQGTKQDFELTPYLVIKNFTHTLTDNRDLILTFTIDAPIGAGMPRVSDVQPYINTTKFVGSDASIKEYSSDLKVTVDKEWNDMSPADKSFTITVPALLSGRIFFVRVGARVNDSYKSVNYSEIVEIKVP